MIEAAAGAHQVRVTGLRETLRSLAQAGADAADLKELMATIGGLVAAAGRPLARHESGAMASSIRPGTAKSKAVVRAGGTAVPYAGVQHYGWPDHGIEPNPFLTNAIARTTPQKILNEFDKGLRDLLKAHQLI